MILLFGLIEKIPATFWGVVVGSLFTIIGVALTNRSNTKRLRLQLEHDRELRRRERDLALRKEVYLAAMEAVSAGLGAVGRAADLNIPHDKLMESFAAQAPAIAKVNIVASEKTIAASASFMAALTGSLLRISSIRVKLGTLQQRVTWIQGRIETTSREQDRLVSLMRELNLAGVQDETRWGPLRDSLAHETGTTDALLAEQQAIQRQLVPDQLRFAGRCIEELRVLNRLLVPVISLIRTDLQLPFDERAYADIVERSGVEQAEHFARFLHETESWLAKLASVEAPPAGPPCG